jgi:hypothetical protein
MLKELLYDLYTSPNFIRIISSRRMSCGGHVARGWRGELHTGFWWEDLMEIDHLKDLGIDGNIIFKSTYKKWDWKALTGMIWHRIGIGGGHLWIRQ